MLGKIKCKRRRGCQRIRWLDSITDSMDMNLSKHLETVKNRGAWYATIHGVTKSQTRLSNWIKTWSFVFLNMKHLILDFCLLRAFLFVNFYLLIYLVLFIWLCWVLAATHGFLIFIATCGIISFVMWDLLVAAWIIFQLGHAEPSWDSILLVVACGISFPDQGCNLDPLHWECNVLASGPPGKSMLGVFKSQLQFQYLWLVHSYFLFIHG